MTYQVEWSDTANDELQTVLAYLIEHWQETQLTKLAKGLENTITNIEKNPRLYPKVTTHNYPLPVHKINIQRFNSLYYAINEDKQLVTILAFFSNRQDPTKIKL